MSKFSIVVPCYNEAKNIPLILERFDKAIKNVELEVILVNNGSTDNSADVLADLIPRYSFARLVIVEHNQGYGFGILTGLKAATGDFLGWTHADLQTDPKDVVSACNLIKEQNYVHTIYIKGLRKGRSWFDTFFTVGMGIFETLYLRCILWDINAQPNMFHRSFYEQWKNPPHDFSLDLYAFYFARILSLDVQRIRVEFPERIHGVSSWNTGFKAKWKLIKRTIEFSGSLKERVTLL